MSTAENTAADAPEYTPTLSPLMQVHGAFAADGPDAGIAAHYGNPLAEQRALVRDRGATTGDPVVVDRSSLGVVRVSGPDRASWLTSLASQILTDMNPGDSREFLLLSPQGRIEYAPAAVEDGQALWLIVEGAQAEPLTDYLNRMKFMLRVDIENMSGEYAVIETARNLRGEQGAIHPVFADALIWRDPWTALVEGGYHYSATPDAHPGTDYERYLSIIPRDKLTTLTESAQLAGVWAAEALRIEAWRPRAGTEIDNKTIPQELDYTRTAVHFEKGCYKGQETVARVHNLGHPPRRLVFLDLDGSEHTLPAAGSELFVEGKPRAVGRITSVALHHEAGPIALAVIKRAVDPAAPLRAVDTSEASTDEAPAPATEYAAAQTLIVSPETGEIARKSLAGQDFLKR